MTENYEEFETLVGIRHPRWPQGVRQGVCICWFCDLQFVVYG